MSRITFIAVDWGSSSFRAWALDRAGQVLDTRKGPDGLKTVSERDFAGVIRRHCSTWFDAAPEAPVLMQGMVGSRTGWVEAAYAPCPVTFDDLGGQATHFDADGRRMVILPGATAGGEDVMRGEEIQIFGAAALTGKTTATICIPGTHSKWAQLEGDALTGFRTFVTGELFQLLLQQSLVGALAQGSDYNEAAFLRGLDRAAALPLSHAVFAARASTLTGGMAPEDLASFLSGVLIGAECAAQEAASPVLLMASGVLADRYERALDHRGVRFDKVDADAATLAGLTRAAKSLWPDQVAA
ncbi:2-dehydro-3-deoxygalactonokinase [Antarctobacter jejuensis]|uniref:2-dehydro-3-deoxygalactonokinase n=1 Tax=Antarctobacter jejuensis TaxID=1439938 RepID=UPI003FD0039D